MHSETEINIDSSMNNSNNYSFFANKDSSFLKEFNTKKINSELCKNKLDMFDPLYTHQIGKYSFLADKKIITAVYFKMGHSIFNLIIALE